MRTSNTTVRFIKPDSIKIGDTIKVEQQYEDATVTKVGRVAKRDHSNYGTDYLTDKGIALYTHTRDDLTKAKITLLERALNDDAVTDRLW